MNKEDKLIKLKNNLENLLSNLEHKKDELYTYLKESELQINTIKNQLHILNNHLYEQHESIQHKNIEEKKDEKEDDEEEDEEDEEEEEEEEDIEYRIMANIDPHLARLLGMEVKEESKSDWIPPSFSGLQNSSRNSMYDHIYKK